MREREDRLIKIARGRTPSRVEAMTSARSAPRGRDRPRRSGGSFEQNFLDRARGRIGRLAPAVAVLANRLRMRIDWDTFEAELAAWRAAGREPTFWWRDDDAVAWTPELQTLLSLAGETPIALAVVPDATGPELARRLTAHEAAAVLQHGWRHANHAPGTTRNSELGPERPLAERLEELARGRKRMTELFGPRALPALVPPWNGIGHDLVPLLPSVGITGLSLCGPRRSASPAPGLRQVNVHADLVDWRSGRSFIGEALALFSVWRHLRHRRLGRVCADEATGLLTHHLLQMRDVATREFISRLILVVRAQGGRFLRASELFPA